MAILEGVQEGRQIFVNLKRSIQWVLLSPGWVDSEVCYIRTLMNRSTGIPSRTVHLKSCLNFYVSSSDLSSKKWVSEYAAIDVVVPIPLPLSAILILVIGMQLRKNHKVEVNKRSDRSWIRVVCCGRFGNSRSLGIPLISFLLPQLSFAWDKSESKDGLMRLSPRKPGPYAWFCDKQS